LGFFNNNYYNNYMSDVDYSLKMIVMNQIIGGLFIPLTPRMVIEGYTDEFLKKKSMESLLDFGDMTLNSWISVDNAAYAQKNNTQVGLNSGSNTYQSTAQFVSIGSCGSDCMNIMVPCKTFTGLYTVKKGYCNPYATSMPLMGTNGQQFSPLLADQGTLAVTTNNLYVFDQDQGMSLNFTAIQSKVTAGSGNYAHFNLIQYNFTGYNMESTAEQ
jgi:hypothetical protein